MLIDINAHVGHWPFQQLQYNSCATMLEKMDRFGVDVSVISNLNGLFYKNTQSANEELYSALKADRRFSDRFIGFAVINPIYANAAQDLKTSRDRWGMKGVRLYPKYHDYALTDPACVGLVKMARDLDMPVALTLRMVDHRQRAWMDIEKEWALRDVMPLIRAVPDAKFVILNIANGANLGAEDTHELRQAKVLMDTSGRALVNLSELVGKYGADKFAFGTHAPIQDYLTGLLRIEAMDDTGTDLAIRTLLRSDNAKRFLKL